MFYNWYYTGAESNEQKKIQTLVICTLTIYTYLFIVCIHVSIMMFFFMFNICVCFQCLTSTTSIFFIMLLFSIRFIHLYFFSIVLYSKYVGSWHAFSVYSDWTFILNACKKKCVPPGVCMYVSIKWLSTNVNIHNESIRQRKNIYRSNKKCIQHTVLQVSPKT